GNLAGAEMCFLRLLEVPYEGRMPDEHVEARHQLALLYRKTGHPTEAEAQWRTILAERPDYAPAIQAMKEAQAPNGVPHAESQACLPNRTKPRTQSASIIMPCCNQL